MPTIAVIQPDPDCPLGILAEALDAAGATRRYVQAWAGEALPDVADADGFVVLGGEMNADALDEHPFLLELRTLMRAAGDAGRPMLGICLGAQVLARAYGAPVYRRRAREIGFHRVEATPAGMSDPILAAFAPAADVFQFHEDDCGVPVGAELLARNEHVEAQAFRIGRAYGVQFHFEVTLAEITAWADATAPGELEEVWGTSREQLLSQATRHLARQQEAGRRAGMAFAELVAQGSPRLA